jgi:hypothetical protein
LLLQVSFATILLANANKILANDTCSNKWQVEKKKKTFNVIGYYTLNYFLLLQAIFI